MGVPTKIFGSRVFSLLNSYSSAGVAAYFADRYRQGSHRRFARVNRQRGRWLLWVNPNECKVAQDEE